MPTARPAKRTRTGSRTAGHAQRGNVVQPKAPLVQLSNELTAAQRQTFIVQSQNQHLTDINDCINFLQSGERDERPPYDTKAG